jgi:glycosyltransferase involved in cell wall biosynthesis
LTKKYSFFINRTENVSGPSIFGYRLKEELIRKGWRWDAFLPSVNYIFSSGFFRPLCENIVRLDGLYFDSENTVGDSDKRNRPIFKAYQKADGIIFQSEFSKMLFEKFMGDLNCPWSVIFNGVGSNFSSKGERVDYGFKKAIICSGKWRVHKRLKCIINGFLEYGDSETCLVILGWGFQKSLEHPNIKYLGKVAPRDLPKFLRGGDAFIHLTWLDNCPNAVVEALACGLPVLCSHNGGTKEIIRTNGIIMQCEEEYNFKKVALYKPPECNSKLVAAGIEQILSWDKPVDADYLRLDGIADQYVAFSERLLG